MHDAAEIDVAIFGGGIAGLWLLRRLLALGFDAALFEKKALGCGQTLASQGILHSGVKYAFDGSMGETAKTLSVMPKIWMDCMAGRGEIDLRGGEFLAAQQCVFNTGGWGGRIASAIAGKAFRSAFEPIPSADLPKIFGSPEFHGEVFRLQEPVVDVKSIVTTLRARTFAAGVKTIHRHGERVEEIIFDDHASFRLRPRACVFAAGQGNEEFAGELGLEKNKVTQRRPLRMFMARGVPERLFAHWLVPEPKPRLTITTHTLEGENIWYIGGNLAEKAIGLPLESALRKAKAELEEVFSWMNWREVRWAAVDINRAEPAANKLLPQGPILKIVGNAALAWPAKLVLAPALAAQALRWLAQLNLTPSNKKTDLPLAPAPVGRYPWEEVTEWMRL